MNVKPALRVAASLLVAIGLLSASSAAFADSVVYKLSNHPEGKARPPARRSSRVVVSKRQRWAAISLLTDARRCQVSSRLESVFAGIWS